VKIALVRQRYTPFGGAERFVERAFGALVEQGVSVTVISRQWQSDNNKGPSCNPFYVGRLWRDAGFAHCVQRLLKHADFDLVQSHERIPGCTVFRAGDGVHAAWLIQRARHAGWLDRQWPQWSPWHRYTLAAEAKTFRDPRLKAVICISRMVRDDIVRHYGVDEAKLHVIYNGLDLERFNPGLALRHRAELRKRMGVGMETPVFLYVGSGFARKGVATLIEAVSHMTCTEAQFWIVGVDKRTAAYQQQAKESGVAARFRFLGGQPDVCPFLGAADAFVLPTIYEPLSNAVLEALASGLPVVTTTSCGAAELIRDDENGYVCEAGDAQQLARYLDVLAAPGIAHAMGEAARASVAHLSTQAMAERLIGMYRSLL
jgi:UDP-glucose:(heptosyl)LPS alpha-1,3-glucosyltransferase